MKLTENQFLSIERHLRIFNHGYGREFEQLRFYIHDEDFFPIRDPYEPIKLVYRVVTIRKDWYGDTIIEIPDKDQTTNGG
jgi:hypothetical protein